MTKAEDIESIDKGSATQKSVGPSKSGAFFVGAGILLSRISGLVRERAFAHYLGNSDASDAFKAAQKIPNVLQNLFGEGVLSASFIPVYASLLAQGKMSEARKVARIVATLMLLITSVLVLLGVLFTPNLIDWIAPGFVGEKRHLTIQCVKIIFPGTGMVVMSAWCLGILNSHRRFFLSYAAPVLWNMAIVITIVTFGFSVTNFDLAMYAAWGLVLGSFLQLGVQLPFVFKLLKEWKPSFELNNSSVRIVFKNFVPVLFSRGVVQISAYVDNMIASYLPTGAVSSLAYAQTLYLLPVSLFGMSISAAELPALSGLVVDDPTGKSLTEETKKSLRLRLNSGLSRIAFFVIPSAVALLFLGDVVISAVFQSGQFTNENTIQVWWVLAGSTLGLLASTFGRLYSSSFYALKDARAPLRFALIRVIMTITLGLICGLYLPGWLKVNPFFGTVGITASSGFASCIEFLLLSRAMNGRIGATGVGMNKLLRIWIAALLGAGVAYGAKIFVREYSVALHHLFQNVFILMMYGTFYFLAAAILKIEEANSVWTRILRRLK